MKEETRGEEIELNNRVLTLKLCPHLTIPNLGGRAVIAQRCHVSTVPLISVPIIVAIIIH